MEENKNFCFIVTPIGSRNSAIRREIDGLINNVLGPVLNGRGYSYEAAHQISDTGSITRQVIKKILDADLVIANLSDLNPNVMYEIGIRHCARKPIIVIARDGAELPFDLSDERTIYYQNDIAGVEEFKAELDAMIPFAEKDENPDNPVYRVVDTDLIRYPDGPPDFDSMITMKMNQIEDKLDRLSNSVSNKIKNHKFPKNNASISTGFVLPGAEFNKASGILDNASIDYFVSINDANRSTLTPLGGENSEAKVKSLFDSENINYKTVAMLI